jgi:hypothetical protein
VRTGEGAWPVHHHNQTQETGSREHRIGRNREIEEDNVSDADVRGSN